MPYHYIDSGLDHVWLVNGYKLHKTSYGEGVAIRDVEGLHRAIGRAIIDAARPLIGAEGRFMRMEMDLTQRRLGLLLGVDEQAVRRWEKFRGKPLQGAADRLLRAVYAEYAGGDGAVRALVERLADLDTVEPHRLNFRETAKGWGGELAA
jgi:putative transcriptional regulator